MYHFMAKRILVAVLALVAMTMQAKVEVEVSETVELVSIISRTAGYQEYNLDMGGQYIEDVKTWFDQYKDHPCVNCFKELRGNYGISHNAPMDLALNIMIDGERIKLIGDKKDFDPRWERVDLEPVLELIGQFYTDTRFHEFYQQHLAFYNETLLKYDTNVMKYFDQDWYARFYGTEPGELFRIIIGFTNGGHNYGSSRQLPGMPKESFSVSGYWIHPQTDYGSVLDPENAKKYAAPILIHEFNHSFVNPLIENEKNAARFGDIPQRMLDQNYNIMSQQAYGEGKTVFNETIVRAATVIYMMEHGYSSDEVLAEIKENMTRGFTWMPETVAALRDYSSHRGKYPTLNDYYPKIAKVLDKYLNQQQERFDKALK